MMNGIDGFAIFEKTMSILEEDNKVHNYKSILDLPNEIISEITRLLPMQDRLSLAATSNSMNSKVFSSDCFHNDEINHGRELNYFWN